MGMLIMNAFAHMIDHCAHARVAGYFSVFAHLFLPLNIIFMS
jgi:hypothetical protein